MRLVRSLHLRRWCWRSWRRCIVVLFPQAVSFYGYWEHGHLGDGLCMGCGSKHGVFR